MKPAPNQTDDRPYWVRQKRTLKGWLGHIEAVKRWKHRNVQAHNRHCVTQYHRRKAQYGAGAIYGNDLAYIEKAKKFNETLAGQKP